MKKKTHPQKRGSKKKITWNEVIGLIVFFILLLSVGYAAVNIGLAPEVPDAKQTHGLLKSDYVLMLTQCVLGIVVLMIPAMLNRRFSFALPNYVFGIYYIFLFCAIYLGEVRSFYYLIPFWDSILHAFSGVMLALLGFALVDILNDNIRGTVHLSPFFVALFAFCFALACGAVWEIYEFLGDGVLGMNMQKFRLADGTLLIGREALQDTMSDIILDACAALLVSVLGFLDLRRRQRQRGKSKTPGAGKEEVPCNSESK